MDHRTSLYASYSTAGPGCEASPAVRDAARSRHLRHVIARYFPAARDARILDVGCGAGGLLELARASGYVALDGVDRSQEQVAAARVRGLTQVVEGDLIDTLRGRAPGSIDMIVAFDVLEHLSKSEMVAFAGAAAAALAPGGCLLIHVPNGASPFVGRILYGDMTHEWAFTQGSLNQLLLPHGFANVSCEEDRPVGSGLRLMARRAVWAALRSGLRLWLAAETGERAPGLVLTQSMFAVATKAGSAS